MKQFILILFLMFAPQLANADDRGVCGDGVTYFYEEATCTLTISKTAEGTGTMDNYDYSKRFAPWYDYAPEILYVNIEVGVTSIGNYAFGLCLEMLSITIPEGVTTIGDGAFSDCYCLTSINIPESVTTIGESSFGTCNLTSLTIPKGVTKIGKYAFMACSSLTKIIAQPTTPPIIGYSTFDDYSVPLIVPRGCVESYENANLWNRFLYISDGSMYKLSYIIDGEIIKSKELQCGVFISPEPDPIREGYTFSGWSDNFVRMPNHDVTITGTFTINKYKVTYIIDDEVYQTVEVEYGSTITPPNPGDHEGYDFAWEDYPTTMPAEDILINGTYTATGIEAILASEPDVKIFTVSGKPLNKVQKGVNILRYKDGRTQKIVVK